MHWAILYIFEGIYCFENVCPLGAVSIKIHENSTFDIQLHDTVDVG